MVKLPVGPNVLRHDDLIPSMLAIRPPEISAPTALVPAYKDDKYRSIGCRGRKYFHPARRREQANAASEQDREDANQCYPPVLRLDVVECDDCSDEKHRRE